MILSDDTIAAVSSGPVSGSKTIIRISGAKAFDVIEAVASANTSVQKKCSIQQIAIALDELHIETVLYKFPSPRSYTGDDIAEIHLCAGTDIVEQIISKLFTLGVRAAEPGEFTYRAYVNGKMDLSQAEAVAEIIASSNSYQLQAAENLLARSLSLKVSEICAEILELLSLTEAGLDFSGEDIEFISKTKAIERAEKISAELNQLLTGTVSFEEMIDAADVGIAGAPNAGKSSLVNALLGAEPSIVSPWPSATRDVLRHMLKLDKCDCVLFDCAGIKSTPAGILDELANTAAITALNSAALVLFCVDISKDDFAEELAALKLISSKRLQFVATKSDLLSGQKLNAKIEKLNKIFKLEFLLSSSKTGNGLDDIGRAVQQRIITAGLNRAESDSQATITQRHRQIVSKAIDEIDSAAEKLSENDDEVTAMFLRFAFQHLSSIENEDIDEKILDNIFANFCIGK